MAKVVLGQRVFLTPLFARPERFLLRCFHVDPQREQDWKSYAKSLLIFSVAGWLLLYLILRSQSIQPWNNFGGVTFHGAPWNVTFNTVCRRS